MVIKKILAVLLVAFVAASIVYLIFRKDTNATTVDASPLPSTPAGTTQPATAEAPRYVVYYFRNNVRCTNCRKIEAWSRDATDEFPEAIRNRELTWKMVDVSQPANRHFIDDYQLQTKSVVLVEETTGRWENLPDIWQLLNNEAAFKRYIHNEIAAFMKR